ncbi:MAG: response regulator transcription factor [Candidatus Eisenbacteria bacterium]
MRVLIVEDYAPLRRSLLRGLKEAGYAVDAVEDGNDGLEYASTDSYDVVVLDVMLPGLDGFEVLKALRSRNVSSRILLLTARDQVKDRVHGLDLGADDYLVKPFALAELLARIRALVRRRHEASSPVLSVGPLEIDTGGRQVKRDGETIDLTAREYSILEILAHRAGRIVTRDEIYDAIYDFQAERSSNVVDVYIGYLRKKIERPGEPKLLETRRGLGYVLGVQE